MRNYVEFTVWNNEEERPATQDEIEKYVRIKIIERGQGRCEIVVPDDFVLVTA